jgi:hypothetical protein
MQHQKERNKYKKRIPSLFLHQRSKLPYFYTSSLLITEKQTSGAALTIANALYISGMVNIYCRYRSSIIEQMTPVFAIVSEQQSRG